MLAIQAASAGDPVASLTPLFQYGIAGVALGVLVFVVRVLRDVHREASERQAAAAKDEAERTAKHNSECQQRQMQALSTVDAISDRFGETQTMAAKTFADAIIKVHEQQTVAQREQRAAHEQLTNSVLQTLQQVHQHIGKAT